MVMAEEKYGSTESLPSSPPVPLDFSLEKAKPGPVNKKCILVMVEQNDKIFI